MASACLQGGNSAKTPTFSFIRVDTQDIWRNSAYVVGEEDAIVVVSTSVINPGVAFEVNSAFPREVLNGDGLKVKLGQVLVLDEDGARDSLAFVNDEGCAVNRLAGDHFWD